jgi:hypothetical protein
MNTIDHRVIEICFSNLQRRFYFLTTVSCFPENHKDEITNHRQTNKSNYPEYFPLRTAGHRNNFRECQEIKDQRQDNAGPYKNVLPNRVSVVQTKHEQRETYSKKNQFTKMFL